MKKRNKYITTILMKSMETLYYLLTFGEESEGTWWNDVYQGNSKQDCIDSLPKKMKKKNYLGYGIIEVTQDQGISSWVVSEGNMPDGVDLISSDDRTHFEVVPT